MSFVASIPSPSSGTIDLGPFTIHMYGLMLLLAIAACVALTGYRWVKWGGDWDLVFRVAVWGVAAGIVGARLYHDITSWSEVPKEWWGLFAVWQGGLGVWGGILFGCLVGAWIVHRSGQSVRLFMDAVAPGLLLAQGIGRIGNWFNQELFGKPTDLPWGLKIDPQHRPAGYFDHETFHPTFLYELTYDLIGVAILLWIDRRFNLRRPGLFALYVSYYCFGRFFEELLRIDPAHEFLGLRLNAWVSLAVFVLSTAFFIWWQFIRTPSSADRPRASKVVPTGPAMAVPKGRVRSGR
ncbi:MAG TPA: prolipoprotein diacylglyceryl transferase [Gaiellaceae bacterium]|nr:prolipoprotein diacylglyceryl transferase [Gaiellaceae bacterium]